MHMVKKERANIVSDYRPISLLNIIYKTITKVRPDRLNPLMEILINKAKTGFIPEDLF